MVAGMMVETVPKLDPAQFHRAFVQLSLVEEGKVRPIRSMAGQTVELHDKETGEIQVLQFVDNPMLRFVEATRMVFPDPEEGKAACLRLFRLFGVIGARDPRVAHFTLEEDGQLLIHESIVKAMALIELDPEGEVSIPALLSEARRFFGEAS